MENFILKSGFLKPEGKQWIKEQIAKARRDGYKWQEIFDSSPLPKTTVHRWGNKDMSVEAQKQRQVHLRNKKLLTDEEERSLIQLAIDRRANYQVVSIEWTREAIASVTNGRVQKASDGYISTFYKRHGWPSRKTQERNKKEIRNTLEQEVNDF